MHRPPKEEVGNITLNATHVMHFGLSLLTGRCLSSQTDFFPFPLNSPSTPFSFPALHPHRLRDQPPGESPASINRFACPHQDNEPSAARTSPSRAPEQSHRQNTRLDPEARQTEDVLRYITGPFATPPDKQLRCQEGRNVREGRSSTPACATSAGDLGHHPVISVPLFQRC